MLRYWFSIPLFSKAPESGKREVCKWSLRGSECFYYTQSYLKYLMLEHSDPNTFSFYLLSPLDLCPIDLFSGNTWSTQYRHMSLRCACNKIRRREGTLQVVTPKNVSDFPIKYIFTLCSYGKTHGMIEMKADWNVWPGDRWTVQERNFDVYSFVLWFLT